MSQITPTDHSAKDATPAIAVPPLEVRFEAFWVNNRRQILTLCASILLFIVGREGWNYFAAQREQGVQHDYSAATGNEAKLAAFAAEHTGHSLSGAAFLTLADAKFTASEYAAAGDLYAKAQANLQNEALVGRAKLGVAISKLNGSDRAGGEAALKAISADATLFKVIRAEASYHLASLAAEAGNAVDVVKYTEEISKLDTGGAWAQRGLMLRTTSGPDAKPEVPAAFNFQPGK